MHQLLCMDMQTPPPLFLPEILVQSQQCGLRLASSTAGLGIMGLSQVSVNISAQQSRMDLCSLILSCGSPILLEQRFVRQAS